MERRGLGSMVIEHAEMATGLGDVFASIAADGFRSSSRRVRLWSQPLDEPYAEQKSCTSTHEQEVLAMASHIDILCDIARE